ncbi:MAG: hypothetical protein JST22_15530 [Bacteroidetes bacterium]|nr:hypothetical protein [Bacteroidota bacterium]
MPSAPRPNHISIRTAAVVAAFGLVAGSARCEAQEVGGYAGAFLNRAVPARSAALAGAFTPFRAGGDALFGNPASLAGLDQRAASFSYSFLPYNQHLGMAGFGMPAGGAAGIGGSIVYYGLSDVPAYTQDGKRNGTTGSSEWAISAAGALKIGPGAIGTTIRYLGFTPVGTGLESSTGYALDLGGMLEFENTFTDHDWFYASATLNNLAGEQKGPHRLAAASARLSGSYLYPLQETQGVPARVDPTGLPTVAHAKPEAYVLGIAEIRLAQYDPLPPAVSLAAECGIPGTPVGIRLGWGTRTSITTGFSVHWPQNLIIDVAGALGGDIAGANAATATITYLF